MLALQRPHILDPPRILASRASSRLHTFRPSHAQYTLSTRAVITPAETGARRGIPMFAVRRRMLSYAHRFGSRRDQRGGQMGLRRQVRLQEQQRTPPTTRQALLTYSHAKCLSSRLTVTSRRRRHGVQSSAQGEGLPGVCGLAWRLAIELRPAWRRATAGRDLRVFSRCRPYSRIRPTLAVPYFFCCQLSKAGLSGYAHHLWLISDPDSRPWQVSGRAGTKTGMTAGRDPETASQKAGFNMENMH